MLFVYYVDFQQRSVTTRGKLLTSFCDFFYSHFQIIFHNAYEIYVYYNDETKLWHMPYPSLRAIQ